MIESIIQLAQSQPLLLAGVGTVATSAGFYLLREVPNRIFSFSKNSLISTMSVESNNEFFEQINSMVFDHRIPWTFRSYQPSYDKNYDIMSDEDRYGGKEKLSPGYGSGWGYWNGIFFSFKKSLNVQGQKPLRLISIDFYTRSFSKVEEFFLKAIVNKEKKESVKVWFSKEDYWENYTKRKKRTFDSIFLDSKIIDGIKNSFENFLNNEEWYNQRGIPYKFVFLFYGQPGTGKTSLIHAIASTYNLEVRYITSLGNLRGLFLTANKDKIFVIEDIDTLFSNLKRKEDQSSEQILHDLLNSLDGFTTPHGIIIAITSNHPENLDPALLRPGRIDLPLEIGLLNFESAQKMVLAHFKDENNRFQLLKDNWKQISGAKLQSILLENNTLDDVMEKLK
jgi:chaperone BCS1